MATIGAQPTCTMDSVHQLDNAMWELIRKLNSDEFNMSGDFRTSDCEIDPGRNEEIRSDHVENPPNLCNDGCDEEEGQGGEGSSMQTGSSSSSAEGGDMDNSRLEDAFAKELEIKIAETSDSRKKLSELERTMVVCEGASELQPKE
nr:hypothetical protein Iba_chr05cCG11310 [Ipomoea batatas]